MAYATWMYGSPSHLASVLRGVLRMVVVLTASVATRYYVSRHWSNGDSFDSFHHRAPLQDEKVGADAAVTASSDSAPCGICELRG